jgi:single-stranded DNA-binding protein
MNIITILGSITRDPDVSVLEDGERRAHFGIASNRSRQELSQTDHFDVVAFGALANKVAEIGRGTFVTIRGHVQVGRQDGHVTYEIVAKAVEPFRDEGDER